MQLTVWGMILRCYRFRDCFIDFFLTTRSISACFPPCEMGPHFPHLQFCTRVGNPHWNRISSGFGSCETKNIVSWLKTWTLDSFWVSKTLNATECSWILWNLSTRAPQFMLRSIQTRMWRHSIPEQPFLMLAPLIDQLETSRFDRHCGIAVSDVMKQSVLRTVRQAIGLSGMWNKEAHRSSKYTETLSRLNLNKS